LGDPFLRSWHYRMNTLKIEKKVITRFAELFHAPKDNYWGYVTNGGTEGNMYGLYVAREKYPNGVVFYSDQTHYCVPKILKLLKMPGIKIKSDEKGEIDYIALQNSLDAKTPIILANIGTTMKGAVDDVLKIKEILSDLKIKHSYIHCDAAFFGMILPFLPQLEAQPFDFRTGIDSIAISGHKLIGTPIPCGAVLCKRSNMKNIGTFIEYTGAQDNTITGSRNGLSPLFLWHELNGSKEGKFEKLISGCIELASYAIQKFNEQGIPAWRNKNSIIVIFPRPSEKLIRKWQLAIEGDIAHLITLPHLSHRIIDSIVLQVASDSKRRRLPRKR
jgi:histidine decarboxylase